MDLQARKISLIQEFLRINSEELINKLDKFLHDEKKKIYDEDLKPMYPILAPNCLSHSH